MGNVAFGGKTQAGQGAQRLARRLRYRSPRKEITDMTDFSDYRRRAGTDTNRLARRARQFLSTRPMESWLFLFAGIVVGAILG